MPASTICQGGRHSLPRHDAQQFSVDAEPTMSREGGPGHGRPVAPAEPRTRWLDAGQRCSWAGKVAGFGARAQGAAEARGLSVTGVSSTVGRRTILDDVTLAVAPGERIAVVGPNGAGKTSLVRLMAGLDRPTRGEVSFDGRPLGAAPPRWRALRIAVVAQTAEPDLRLTLTESVGLGRVPHRGRVTDLEHGRIVAAALERVGLEMLAKRRLDSLSGGERQRGAIARAIAQQPELLILDEPTNHLDPRARADVLDLARGLGIAVVAVLHDLALVGAFADRVAVLDRGRLVAFAPPAEALAPATVRAVFAMECFTATSPGSGRDVLVFHPPQRLSGRC